MKTSVSGLFVYLPSRIEVTHLHCRAGLGRGKSPSALKHTLGQASAPRAAFGLFLSCHYCRNGLVQGVFCEKIIVIGNPFLHFHAIASLDELIMIKYRLWEGGDPRSTEEKWGPVLAWQTNPSTHPFDWMRGLVVVPVTSTAHKQAAHSQSEGLAGVIKVIESIPTPHPSLMWDTELLGKSSGGKVTVAYTVPWRENDLDCVCGGILCLIPWEPKQFLGLAGCVMATAKKQQKFGVEV